MLPAGERLPIEMVEAELRLEFLILLFDRPALMGERQELCYRGRGGQMHEGSTWSVAYDRLGCQRALRVGRLG